MNEVETIKRNIEDWDTENIYFNIHHRWIVNATLKIRSLSSCTLDFLTEIQFKINWSSFLDNEELVEH